MNEGDLDLIHQLRNGGRAYEYDYKLKVIPAAIGELAADHIEAQNKLIEDMWSALWPFAKQADRYDPPENDSGNVAWSSPFCIGDLREARSAFSKASKSNPNTPEGNDK